jgi:hypothetical protein
MTRCWKWLLVGLASLILPPTLAAEGAWKFKPDSQDHLISTYSENGKTPFMIGCGRAFGLQADGEFATPDEDSATIFLQWRSGRPHLCGLNQKRT